MPKYTVTLRGNFTCKMQVEAADKTQAIVEAEETFAMFSNVGVGPNIDYCEYQHDETDVTMERS